MVNLYPYFFDVFFKTGVCYKKTNIILKTKQGYAAITVFIIIKSV